MLNFLTSRKRSEESFNRTINAWVAFFRAKYRYYSVDNVKFKQNYLYLALRNSHRDMQEYKDPSPFKAAGSITANLVVCAPISTPLPANVFTELHRKQNAIMAFFLAAESLYKTTLFAYHGEQILSNRIEMSDHFFEEFVCTISRCNGSNPLKELESIALIYEALAYGSNPCASYLSFQKGKSKYF